MIFRVGARAFIACLVAGICAVALAAPLPYDEAADAKADVQRALRAAASAHVPVLIVFGANWCEDCRVLDRALHDDQSARLLARSFRVVKVDVGNFDRNLDITSRYGDPIGKGIPAVVVVSADNRVLYSTRAGELADARMMSPSGIFEFFRRVSQSVAAL